MSFNPYAPPAAPLGPEPGQGPSYGGPAGWEPGEVMQTAWEIVKVHWATLIFAPLVGQLVAGVPGQLIQAVGQRAAQDSSDPMNVVLITGLVSTLVGLVIGAYFTVGIIRIMLSAARGHVPSFNDLFSGGSRFLPMLGAQLLVGLVVLVGFILLIIPGIYAALALSQTQYFVVDQNMSPIDAMKASWQATEGQKGKIFLFGLLGGVVILLGLAACCIGVLPASAVVGLGQAIIFTRLTGTMGSPPPFAAYAGMPHGPPGWGGPPPGGPPGWGPPPGAPPGYGPPPQGPGWG